MFSASVNPRLCDEATCFEGVPLVLQMVDDEVEDLRWEGAGHVGFGQGVKLARATDQRSFFASEKFGPQRRRF